MKDADILREARKIAWPYGFLVNFPGNFKAKGVQGDEPTYTKVLVLTARSYGNVDPKLLSDVATRISNTVPINKVLIEIVPLGGIRGPEVSFQGIIELDQSIAKTFLDGRHLLFQGVFPTTHQGSMLIAFVQSEQIIQKTKNGLHIRGHIAPDVQNKAVRRQIRISFDFLTLGLAKARYKLLS